VQAARSELILRLEEARQKQSASPSPSSTTTATTESKTRSTATSSRLFNEVEGIEGDSYGLTRLRAREGTLGDNVAVGDKEMYALAVKLSDMRTEALFVIDTAAGEQGKAKECAVVLVLQYMVLIRRGCLKLDHIHM